MTATATSTLRALTGQESGRVPLMRSH